MGSKARSLFTWLTASGAMIAAPAVAQYRAEPPIYLESERIGDGVQIKVMGRSPIELEASYALEVQSDARAGGNKSVQRGRARLRPGEVATLVNLKLGNAREGEWKATLSVNPVGGEEYVIETGPEARP